MKLGQEDRFGLLHPAIDAHTLGISAIEGILADCGVLTFIAPEDVNEAAGRAREPDSARLLRDWIKGLGLTAIGFSYRLDPADGLRLFSDFMEAIRATGCGAVSGGPLRWICFAGLPETCGLVAEKYPGISALFGGDEDVAGCLAKLGVDGRLVAPAAAESAAYDEARMAFGRETIASGHCESVRPIDRSGSRHFGEKGDSLEARVAYGRARGLPPLIRAHVGPYLPDRGEAVRLFLDWTRRLASGGLLDILSIGTSQLSQSAFGLPWDGLQDGGGVPLASPGEFAEIWRSARPMLVRSYAGSRNVEAMARMLEGSVDMAWHALSLWWFSRLDGRGPNEVLENLRQHKAALAYIGARDKPFEPNVPHHFAFRGADDLSYVLSGLVAAKTAKESGIGKLVLQVMLNTPRGTWGINDLAKARALLHLVRELEDADFKVYLQPRGGLDHFSSDPATAKAQLAAVTALMDDIEPLDASSPQIIHVVSFSEGYALADPETVEESIRITRCSLDRYRALREKGEISDMTSHPQVIERTSELIRDCRMALAAIESAIPDPYSAEGLYEILASGFLAVPGLSACRDEFAEAVRRPTRTIQGRVLVTDEDGKPVQSKSRIAEAADVARRRASLGLRPVRREA